MKIEFVQHWFSRLPGAEQLDEEQAAAIAETGSNVQVVARAGSGKTRTLISRALFLQQHCGVAPTEMLLLAFNREAAEQMVERLHKSIPGQVPQAMTFHALAYALVNPSQTLLYNTDEDPVLTAEVQRIIDGDLRNPDPEWRNKIRALMLAHFRENWESIIEGGHDWSQAAFLQYRCSLPRLTLQGGYVKSWGEKIIADFLFEHSIGYSYEKNWWWDRRNYRPDFTLSKSRNSGVIIEYFGRYGDPDLGARPAHPHHLQAPSWQLPRPSGRRD